MAGRDLRRRDLSGWSTVGNRGPGDLAPRWEPDNSLRAIAGRLVSIVVPLAGAIPVSFAGLVLVNWWYPRAAAWKLPLGLPEWMFYALAGAQILLVLALPALVWAAVRVIRHAPAPARVAVEVEVTGLDPGIPTGQLVYRRFDVTGPTHGPVPVTGPPGPPGRPRDRTGPRTAALTGPPT